MQTWLLPYRRGKLNYEHVGAMPLCIQHDVGFSGRHLYRVVEQVYTPDSRGNKVLGFIYRSPRFETRREVLEAIRQMS